MAIILCLSTQEIRQPRLGGQRSVDGSLRALVAAGHEVVYLCPQHEAVDVELAPRLRIIGVPTRPREGLRSLLYSLWHRLPYKFAKYHSAALRQAAVAAGHSTGAEWLLIHGSHLGRLGLEVAQELEIPAVLRPHNLEYRLVEQYAAELPQPLRAAARWQAWLTRRCEQALWQKYDHCCFISDSDRQQAVGIARDARCVYDGIAPPPPPPDSPPPPMSFIMSGLLYTAANKHSIRWFLQQLWLPLWRDGRLKGATLSITGESAELYQLADVGSQLHAGHGIRLTGVVPDFQHEVARHAWFVSPTRIGSGYRFKVIEAGAAGAALLLCPLDVQMLDFLRDGYNCRQFDDAGSFMQVLALAAAERDSLRRQFATDLQATMDWSRHAEQLLDCVA